MKIVFFIHSLNNGGAERVTANMARYWSDAGHTVTILTIAATSERQYELPAAVDHRSINKEIPSTGPISAVRNNHQRIKSLRAAIKELDPDVVISMMAPANILLALAGIGVQTQLVGSERNYPIGDHSGGQVWHQLRRFTYYFLDTIVTQTKITEEWIESNTLAKNVITIPNPLVLPLPKHDPIVPPYVKEGRKLILAVGRLTAQKQFDHLIKAFSRVSEQHPNWDLVILGHGEDHDKLMRLKNSLNLEKRVTLAGRVGNVSDWLNVADIFTLTSKVEGFPNALIEAMAHNTAVISYNCPTGPAEIIEHGENGLLVQPNDITEYSSMLEELINSSMLRSRLSTNAQAVTENLAIDPIMKRWEKIIH